MPISSRVLRGCCNMNQLVAISKGQSTSWAPLQCSIPQPCLEYTCLQPDVRACYAGCTLSVLGKFPDRGCNQPSHCATCSLEQVSTSAQLTWRFHVNWPITVNTMRRNLTTISKQSKQNKILGYCSLTLCCLWLLGKQSQNWSPAFLNCYFTFTLSPALTYFSALYTDHH